MNEQSQAPAAGPVTESERIITLDVLRGFALFGILMVNMPFFSMPFFRAIIDPSLPEGPLSERLAFSAVKLLFEYKFISLFSLLFGIGFVVQLMRARQRGGPFASVYLRRLAVLFLIGLAHVFVFWYGDILLMYSLAAVVLLFCASLSSRMLLAGTGAALLAAIVLGTAINGAQHLAVSDSAEKIELAYAEAEQVVAEGDAPSGFDAIRRAQFDPGHPIWVDAETRAFRDGPFADAAAFRAVMYSFALIFAAFSYGWHILAMFLLGAALMKLNFFSANRRVWHMRLACIALPLGLLLEAGNTYVYWKSGYDFSLGIVLMIPVHEVGSVLLMLGYVGVICLIVRGEYLSWITTPLAAAGRMALTVYLGQTVIATAMMYWWGLGWFGSLSRVEMIGLVFVIFAVLVAFSHFWLRFFQYGPMEWLWRTLTYLKSPPMLRRAAV